MGGTRGTAIKHGKSFCGVPNAVGTVGRLESVPCWRCFAARRRGFNSRAENLLHVAINHEPFMLCKPSAFGLTPVQTMRPTDDPPPAWVTAICTDPSSSAGHCTGSTAELFATTLLTSRTSSSFNDPSSTPAAAHYTASAGLASSERTSVLTVLPVLASSAAMSSTIQGNPSISTPYSVITSTASRLQSSHARDPASVLATGAPSSATATAVRPLSPQLRGLLITLATLLSLLVLALCMYILWRRRQRKSSYSSGHPSRHGVFEKAELDCTDQALYELRTRASTIDLELDAKSWHAMPPETRSSWSWKEVSISSRRQTLNSAPRELDEGSRSHFSYGTASTHLTRPATPLFKI
jgi:hypothetical protein